MDAKTKVAIRCKYSIFSFHLQVFVTFFAFGWLLSLSNLFTLLNEVCKLHMTDDTLYGNYIGGMFYTHRHLFFITLTEKAVSFLVYSQIVATFALPHTTMNHV